MDFYNRPYLDRLEAELEIRTYMSPYMTLLIQTLLSIVMSLLCVLKRKGIFPLHWQLSPRLRNYAFHKSLPTFCPSSHSCWCRLLGKQICNCHSFVPTLILAPYRLGIKSRYLWFVLCSLYCLRPTIIEAGTGIFALIELYTFQLLVPNNVINHK